MKYIFFLLVVVFLSVSFKPKFHCPVTGLDKNGNVPSTNLVALNKLKNRSNIPTTIDNSITLEKILESGNDRAKFSNIKGVTITGYISDAIPGGDEDCNCMYTQEPFIDTHIEIALTPNETDKKKVMVVEMSPRFKAKHGDWRTTNVKALIGKKVTITGWMFFDEKHWQNSVNTNPNGTNLYRKTAWEIHPITDFKVE